MSDSPSNPITKTTVTEHPISEADAKKYPGTGDFVLPTSPLDELMATDQPEIKKPEPVVTTPAATPASPAKPEILEDKAKEMLKELDKAVPPKKKRKSSAVTKMALAAVLVTLVGLGGAAGVKYMGMTTEDRSDAAGNYCCRVQCCDGSWATTNCQSTPPTANQDLCAGPQGMADCGSKGNAGSCDEDDPTPPPDPTIPPNFPGCDNAGEGTGTTPVGGGTCTTQSGKNTGEWCACNFVPAADNSKGVWQCAMNTSQCPSEDGTVAGNGACLGNGGIAIEKTPEGCLRSKNGDARTFTIYRCEGQSAVDNAGRGCQENLQPITGTTACPSVPYNGWCGVVQVDYGSGDNLCFVSSVFECDEDEGTTSSYSCTSLNKDKAAPKIGETVTFTCAGSATGTSINHYEFQYQVDTAAFQSLLATGATTTLKIAKKGTYKVQCRACESADTSKCTTWGLAK